MKKSFLFAFVFAILLNFSACESQKAEKNEINSSASLNLKQDEMRLKSVDCGADKSAQNAECNENLSANSNANLNSNSSINSNPNTNSNVNSSANLQETPNLEPNSSQNLAQKPIIKVFATAYSIARNPLSARYDRA